jgi:uncharacterized membrane protein
MATAARDQGARRNVNDVERVLSVVAGGALAAYALRRRGVGGLLAGALGGALVERGATGHCHVYAALDVDTLGGRPRRVEQRHGPAAVLDASKSKRVVRSVTVADKSPDELFAFWRDFENLPRIMKHVERVEVLDDRRSRWVVRAPAGRTVEWEAEVYNEIPGQLIAWRTLHDADVANAGSVRFRQAPGGRGTEVCVELEYAPPGGKVGAAVARLFGEHPELQVREDLRRFKQLMEAGELAVSEIPGQGGRARRTWNARASNDAEVRASMPERESPHAPTLVPTPADAARGQVNPSAPEVRA